MNKDNFELKIGEQLREARMQVPDGAWEAIKAQINPAATGLSSTSFITGLGAGAVLLASLATYSYVREVNVQADDEGSLTTTSVVRDATVFEGQESLKTTKFELNTLVETAESEPKKLEGKVSEIVETFEKEVAEQAIRKEKTPAIELANIPSKTADTIETEPIGADRRIAPLSITQVDDKAEKAENQLNRTTEVAPAEARIEASSLKGYAPFKVFFSNLGRGERVYWDFGVLGDSQKSSPEMTFSEPGLYTIYLEVSNSNGDQNTDFVTIEVLEPSVIDIPNSISPNGDGLNDVFKVGRARGIEEFILIITNERGDVIFQTRNLDQEWEFDRSMHSQENSLYFYTYRALGVDGKTHSVNLQPLTVILN